MARDKSMQNHKRKPTTQGINKKAFHEILAKAAQPIKKPESDSK